MTASEIDLASLLCSRLCHDMLSPIGALNNGLELLADETDPTMRERCIDLLTESAQTSTQKLKFFRLAFGAAGGFGSAVDVAEPKSLIEGLIAGNDRIILNWSIAAETLPKQAVKILLNLSHIGIEALIRGGDLTIGAEIVGDAVEIAVRATGAKVVVDQDIAAILDGSKGAADVSARSAAAYMVRQLAIENGGALQVAKDEGMLVMGAIVKSA